MDIEAMAEAMFHAYHARYSRVRNWRRHNEQDVGLEFGKGLFRHMAEAAAKVAVPVVEAPVEPVVEAPAEVA